MRWHEMKKIILKFFGISNHPMIDHARILNDAFVKGITQGINQENK